MPFARTIIQGRAGTYMLSDPRPRIRINRLAVDEREDTWQADRFPNALLAEGRPHPHFPGLILETADFDEIAPAFDAVPGSDAQPGDYRVNCRWTGNAVNGERYGATKILQRGKSRTLESGWDQRSVRYLSWHAAWKSCTATAADDVVICPAHGFKDGQRIAFARLTGGAGITPQSSTSLGTIYFVINATAESFQIATSAGGSAVDITTNMTAGEVIAAEFALGAPHPDHASLFLAELQTEDDNTDWKTATAVYRGLEEGKPYHRVITVNGQQFSSSSPITNGGVGGWEDARYTNFHLPEIVVTDTYLVSSGSLPTTSVPSFETPPNAPSVPSIVLTDDTSDLTWNYPYGWTLIACPHVATLNSQIAAMAYSKVYRYIWPVMFR